MTVGSAGERFAIPQDKLVELVRAGSDEGEGGRQIEMLQGKAVMRLRGNLLPLASLSEVLGLSASPFQNENGKVKADLFNVVVIRAEDFQFGLVVDQIQDTSDIVVKPLNKFLKSLGIFSGATIMGDGSVALILDVTGIGKLAGLTANLENKTAKTLASVEREKANADSQELLVFKTAAAGSYCMPLCLVQRLEEFDCEKIEYSGGQPVVQYRDGILPLVLANKSLKFEYAEDLKKSRVSVIVTEKRGKLYGLVVNEVLDIINADRTVDDSIKDRVGIVGNLMWNDEIIVVIDPGDLIDLEYKGENVFFKPSDSNVVDLKPTEKHKVMYVEDTAFFRRQVAKALTEAGYEVITANDGREGLEVLEKHGAQIKVVISDIEMPKLNGFGFAQEVRKHPKYSNMPLIALTTKFREVDLIEGKKCGFNLYLEKLKKDEVLVALKSLIETTKKGA